MWHSQQGNSFCIYVCMTMQIVILDGQTWNIHTLHICVIVDNYCHVPVYKVWKYLYITLHIRCELKALRRVVEIISSDCTILFCRTNLALFINILFGWKVASTVWAVYAIMYYYYSMLILKQRYLTYKHDVYRALQSGVHYCTNVRNIRRENGNIRVFLSHLLSVIFLYIFLYLRTKYLTMKTMEAWVYILSLHSEPKRITIT